MFYYNDQEWTLNEEKIKVPYWKDDLPACFRTLNSKNIFVKFFKAPWEFNEYLVRKKKKHSEAIIVKNCINWFFIEVVYTFFFFLEVWEKTCDIWLTIYLSNGSTLDKMAMMIKKFSLLMRFVLEIKRNYWTEKMTSIMHQITYEGKIQARWSRDVGWMLVTFCRWHISV